MADNIKVYEEKKKAMPIWAWLLPLLLLLALLAFFLTRHRDEPATAGEAAPAAAAAAFPDLGTVHFDTDKATLTPEGQATLQKAAAAMKGNPNVHLRLEGYTDSTGAPSHNDTLSDQRAKTVVDYLQSQGIDRSRLTGEGFGAAKPVDTNATAQGKADNRRVELFSQQ
ncbi:MAG TPA: OmpA family protein [Acidisarcina sp.]